MAEENEIQILGWAVKSHLLKILDIMQQKISRRSDRNYTTKYIKTGFSDLQFRMGDLITLSSRPYVGKTSFALNLVKNIAVQDKLPVGLIIPGNLTTDDIIIRLLSICSGVDSCRVRSGMLRHEDSDKFQEAASSIYDAPLYFYDEPNCSIDQIEVAIKHMVENYDTKMIVLEEFELIRDLVDSNQNPVTYRATLERVLDKFVDFTYEYNITILLVIGLQGSNGKDEPSLIDFKKYFVIPYKSDMVLFVHRDRFWGENGKPEEPASLFVAKDSECQGQLLNLMYSRPTQLFREKKFDE
ncbi:MAG: hypothetical protein IK024_10790 [Treponema sp.]|nr:hypothetical protein [Treponema sp.]